jgi:DNA repair protein RecO (recombination protein O)
MSSLVRTEAIVLRTIKYRETSKIVTFYTREFGKVKAIAKGARQAKSKFGASLEPMSHVALVMYKKDRRDLQLVSQCDILTTFRNLYDDIGKMAVGMLIIELVDKVSHDEDKHVDLFHLLHESLAMLNAATRNPKNLLYGFEIRLSTLLGFHLSFQQCAICRKPVMLRNGSFALFHIGKGGPLCSSHTRVDGLKVKLGASTLDTLAQLSAVHNLYDGVKIEIDSPQEMEIESLLLGYMRYHLEGLNNLKAGAVLKQIIHGGVETKLQRNSITE